MRMVLNFTKDRLPKLLNLIILSALASLSCGKPASPTSEISRYEFVGRDGIQSSVDYSSSTLRWVQLSELGETLERLTEQVDLGKEGLTPGSVQNKLLSHFAFAEPIDRANEWLFLEGVLASQTKYSDFGDLKVSLSEIMPRTFRGVSEATSPEAFVRQALVKIDEAAHQRANGQPSLNALGQPSKSVTLTSDGVQYDELLPKFVFGGALYFHAASELLGEMNEGQGLRADHTANVPGQAYTALEHSWDEAFGLYGAARDFADYSLEELAQKGGRPDWKKGYHDTQGDGRIDLRSEYNFYNVKSAASRDLSSSSNAKTLYSRQAFNAFVSGRQLLANTRGALKEADLKLLRVYRDDALDAWEKTLAANTVHYLNEVLQDMRGFGTAGYDFDAHAAHWSEMKGFALGLQFNPRSDLSLAQFTQLHTWMGDAPVLPNRPTEDIQAYKVKLSQIRSLLQTTYGFDVANMGNDAGEMGW